MVRKKESLYVAFDVEAAGPLLGKDSTLSVGACVVTREPLSIGELVARGLVFYAELKPDSLSFDEKAMRVGCLHLECLPRALDARFDPKAKEFEPLRALERMREAAEDPSHAAARFKEWLARVSEGGMVVPLVDTVFFDSGRVNLWLNRYGIRLGHGGRDLKSLYLGFARRRGARLKEIKVPRNRKPHRADYDAVELARRARIVLYEELGW